MAEITDSLTRSVKEYYGTVLSSSEDLQTSACCAVEAPPDRVRDALKLVHPEVLDRFYGCGSPIPPALGGATVVDLGCGSGRDAYVIAQLVGAEGRVIGIDMTPEQLAVARAHTGWHAERFGFANVEFRDGRIEDLVAVGIADASVDVVVSNCVLNLATDKAPVFAEILRVLKPGGELYFSDVFADRRIPQHLSADPVLRGECLGGALYVEDFRRMLARVGCHDARVMTSRPLSIDNPALEAQVGAITFSSTTIRAFQLDLEDREEDYGQVATYLGTITEMPDRFELDERHVLQAGQAVPVSGNSSAILRGTRYAPHFRVEGATSTHHGPFGRATVPAPGAPAASACC